MDDYKSNSDKSREEKVVTKAITGTATRREKSKIQKFMSTFLPSDVTDIKSYLWDEILVPSGKRMLLDVAETFLGTSGNRNASRDNRPSYRRYYDDTRSNVQAYKPQPSAKLFEFDEVILNTKADAIRTINSMYDVMAHYDGVVTVGDLYDLTGLSELKTWTYEKYGWTDLGNVQPVRMLDGRYTLDLPRPIPITR